MTNEFFCHFEILRAANHTATLIQVHLAHPLIATYSTGMRAGTTSFASRPLSFVMM